LANNTSRDDIQYEILRFVRTERIGFQKGLIERPDNNAIGYAGDIENMDIIDGVAVRRRGTRCLNDPDVALDIIAMHSTIISGCPVLFLITREREVKAALIEYPERIMTVFKKGFAPLKPELTGENAYILSFRKGSQFFFLESDEKLRIMSNLGETYTINKLGYIQVFSKVVLPTEIELPTDIIDARTDTNNACLGLEIEDTTHIRPPKFYLVRDKSRRCTPVSGEICVGIENNEGVVGPMSESIVVPEYGHFYVSLVNAKCITNGFDFLGFATPFDSAQDVMYVRRNVEFYPASNTFVFSSYTRQDSPPHNPQEGTSVFSANVYLAITTKGNVCFWFDYQSLAEDIDAPSIPVGVPAFGSPILFYDQTIKSIKNTNDISASGGVIESDAFIQSVISPYKFFHITKRVQTYVPFKYAVETDTNTKRIINDGANKYVGEVYFTDIPAPIYGSIFSDDENIVYLMIKDDLNYYPVIPENDGTGKILGFAKARITMLRGSDGKLYFMPVYFKYDFKAQSGYFLHNKGFDCWDGEFIIRERLLSSVSNPALQITAIDQSTCKVSLSPAYDIFVPCEDPTSNDYLNWMQNGRRFVVWNNGNIISRSQMAYMNSSGTIVYDFINSNNGQIITDD